jgi:hypothetical protein
VNTKCVSFNDGYSRVRVRIPNQVKPTQFGGVVGVNSISTSADATAQMGVIPGQGVLPFGITGFTGDTTNQICYTNSGCGGGSSDTLVAIDAPLVGNPAYGGTRDCPASGNSTGLANRLETNVAQGVDHFYDIYSAPQRNDNCTAEVPNALWQLSRDFSNDLKAGLVTGPTAGTTYPDGKKARLARFPGDGYSKLPAASAYSPAWEKRLVGSGSNYYLDNRPLWEFIPTTAAGIPSSCTRVNFDNGGGGAVSGGQAKMLTCLGNYANGNPGGWAPLFTARSSSNPNGLYDIQLSSRMGYVPILGSSSTGWTRITDFKLFFINTVYTNCSGGCDTPDSGGVFRTGEGAVGSPLAVANWSTFEGIAAVRLYDGALPKQVTDSSPQNHGTAVPLSLVQ